MKAYKKNIKFGDFIFQQPLQLTPQFCKHCINLFEKPMGIWAILEEESLFPKATDHIPDMISMIEKLIQNKMAYVGEDRSVYFDISSFKDYGKLSNVK